MNIELLREYCLSLPDVTEDVKWGHDLCFCIHEKMFCVTGLSNEPMMVSLKVTDEEFEELIASENIISAPYVGRYKWILVQNVKRFSMKEWKHYIKQSYDLINKNKSVKNISVSKSEKSASSTISRPEGVKAKKPIKR